MRKPAAEFDCGVAESWFHFFNVIEAGNKFGILCLSRAAPAEMELYHPPETEL